MNGIFKYKFKVYFKKNFKVISKYVLNETPESSFKEILQIEM